MHDTNLEFQKQVINSLARLETNMTTIVGGPGQPGVLSRHEDRIHDLEKEVGETRGSRSSNRVWYAAVSAVVLSLVGDAIHFFSKR